MENCPQQMRISISYGAPSKYFNFSFPFQIGCNDNIWGEKLPSTQQVEAYVKSDSLSDILQLPVLNWYLTSDLHPFRTRRDVSLLL